MYLEPAPGEAGISNILKMAREGLRPDLSAGPAQGGHHPGDRPHARPRRQDQRPLHAGQPEHPSGEHRHRLAARVVALPGHSGGNRRRWLRRQIPAAATDEPVADAEARIAALKQELRAKEEYLQSTPRGAGDLQRGAQVLERGNAVGQRGTAIHQRGAGNLQGGIAVGQRGAGHGQHRAADQGGRPVARQQRHEQPAGRHRHRHRVRGPSAAHPALHPGGQRHHQPDPRATSGGRSPTSSPTWSATTRWWPTCRPC